MTRLLSLGFTALAALAFLGMLALFAVQSLPVWRHAGLGFSPGQAVVLPRPRVRHPADGLRHARGLGRRPDRRAPLGIGTALFTVEVLPRRARLAVKTAVELLAGIPSVVYGLLGVLLLRDWVVRLLAPWDPLSGDTLLTGGLLLAVMILPTVMTLADDALSGVSAAQRLAARALGLTRAETALRVGLRQALPGPRLRRAPRPRPGARRDDRRLPGDRPAGQPVAGAAALHAAAGERRPDADHQARAGRRPSSPTAIRCTGGR